jgi:4'-phosphopantetheinyl transferase
MELTGITLAEKEVHLWRAGLNISVQEEEAFLATLSEQEKLRTERFHFPLHRRRFIAARGRLRQVLSYYQHIKPEAVNFLYQERGKPYLEDLTLQFNVSHSNDLAVYALIKNHPIGVDIEKIENKFSEGVARRYFHPEEYTRLIALPMEAHAAEFYRIWARKEALIKALGEGLHFTLNSFSIAQSRQKVILNLENNKSSWLVEDFITYPEYQSAFATSGDVDKIAYFEWKENGPHSADSFSTKIS